LWDLCIAAAAVGAGVAVTGRSCPWQGNNRGAEDEEQSRAEQRRAEQRRGEERRGEEEMRAEERRREEKRREEKRREERREKRGQESRAGRAEGRRGEDNRKWLIMLVISTAIIMQCIMTYLISHVPSHTYRLSEGHENATTTTL
jgi:Flp pilus assembly protein TadB